MDATGSIYEHFSEILQAIIDICESDTTQQTAVHDAEPLAQKLDQIDTVLLCTN